MCFYDAVWHSDDIFFTCCVYSFVYIDTRPQRRKQRLHFAFFIDLHHLTHSFILSFQEERRFSSVHSCVDFPFQRENSVLLLLFAALKWARPLTRLPKLPQAQFWWRHRIRERLRNAFRISKPCRQQQSFFQGLVGLGKSSNGLGLARSKRRRRPSFFVLQGLFLLPFSIRWWWSCASLGPFWAFCAVFSAGAGKNRKRRRKSRDCHQEWLTGFYFLSKLTYMRYSYSWSLVSINHLKKPP